VYLACGGILNATSGEIRSVDADRNGQYENDLDCTWQIIVPVNQRITIQFTNFSLEAADATGQCRDYVQVG